MFFRSIGWPKPRRLGAGLCVIGMLTGCGSTSLYLGDDDSGPPREVAAVPDGHAQGAPTIGDDGLLVLDAGNSQVFEGQINSDVGGNGTDCTFWWPDSGSFICAKGTVAMNSSSQSWGGASFNVNQSTAGGTTNTAQLSGTDVTVYYVNYAGSPLRLQVSITGSDMNWYYPLNVDATSDTFPLSLLQTMSPAEGNGNYFDTNTPVSTIGLVVPGNPNNSTPFEFCFLGLTIQ